MAKIGGYKEEIMTTAEKKAFQKRRQDLIKQGIDKDLASLMAKIDIEYGIIKPVVEGK